MVGQDRSAKRYIRQRNIATLDETKNRKFKRSKYEEAIILWLKNYDEFRYVVTLTFEDGRIKENIAESAISKLLFAVDRGVLGSHSKAIIPCFPMREYTKVGNLHYHILFKDPMKLTARKHALHDNFREIIKNKWKRMKVSGKVHISVNNDWFKQITHSSPYSNVEGYISKDLDATNFGIDVRNIKLT